MRENRNFGLDVVRATAIWCVLVAHLFASTVLAHLGFIGVELFFVLSGFLIGRILIKMALSPNFSFSTVGIFWARRWFRTLPAYYVFLGLYYVFWKCGFLGSGQPSISYMFFLQNFSWPISGFFEVSWSLSVEEWFYLLSPIIALFLINFITPRWAILVCIITFLTICLVFRLNQDVADWDYDIRKQVIYRLDAIGFGFLLAWIFRFKSHLWISLQKFKWFIIGLSLFFVGGFAAPQNITFITALGFTLVPFGLMLSLPWCYALKWPSAGLFYRVVSFSSLWSYSAYLCHMLVFLMVERLFSGPHGLVDHLALRVFELMLIIVISAASFVLIERSGLNLRDRFFRENGN